MNESRPIFGAKDHIQLENYSKARLDEVKHILKNQICPNIQLNVKNDKKH